MRAVLLGSLILGLSVLTGCATQPISHRSMGSASDGAAPPPPPPPSAPVPTIEVAPAPVTPVVVQPGVPSSWASCPPADPCGPCNPYPTGCWHVGAGLEAFPGLGVTVFGGRTFHWDRGGDMAWEVGLTWQDHWEEFSGEGFDGKMYLARVGLVGRQPLGRCMHWTWRAGIFGFDHTGRPEQIDFWFVDIPGEDVYVGPYGGLGLEWDINRNWSTGPELMAYAGWGLDEGGFAFTPTLRWSVTYRW